MQIRQKLIDTRKSKSLSRRQVAEALDITEAFYGMIERGARQPALDLAQRIARYFDSSTDELFGLAA